MGRLYAGWAGAGLQGGFLATLGPIRISTIVRTTNAGKVQQERCAFINHAIFIAGRPRQPQRGGTVSAMSRGDRRRTVVSGAKVVGRSRADNYNFVVAPRPHPGAGQEIAVVFMVPTNRPGVEVHLRTSYE